MIGKLELVTKTEFLCKNNKKNIFRFVNLASVAPRIFPSTEVKVILGVDRLDYTKGI